MCGEWIALMTVGLERCVAAMIRADIPRDGR